MKIVTWNINGATPETYEQFYSQCIMDNINIIALQEVPRTTGIFQKFFSGRGLKTGIDQRGYKFAAVGRERPKPLENEKGYLIFWDPTSVDIFDTSTIDFYVPEGFGNSRPPLKFEFTGVGINAGKNFNLLNWHNETGSIGKDCVHLLSESIKQTEGSTVIAGDFNVNESFLSYPDIFPKWHALSDPKYPGELGGGLDHILSNHEVETGHFSTRRLEEFKSDNHFPVLGGVDVFRRRERIEIRPNAPSTTLHLYNNASEPNKSGDTGKLTWKYTNRSKVNTEQNRIKAAL